MGDFLDDTVLIAGNDNVFEGSISKIRKGNKTKMTVIYCEKTKYKKISAVEKRRRVDNLCSEECIFEEVQELINPEDLLNKSNNVSSES